MDYGELKEYFKLMIDFDNDVEEFDFKRFMELNGKYYTLILEARREHGT